MQQTSSHPEGVAGVLTPIDLAKILVRRWRWIGASVLICVAAAIIYLQVKTPVYAVRVDLRIGQVANSGAFDDAEVLSSRLRAQYGQIVADGVRREHPFLKRVTASKSVPNTIELVAEGVSPEEAAGLLKRVFDEVRAAHDKTYMRSLELLEERLSSIDTQRETLQQQYRDASLLMEQLKSDDPVQASLMALERSRLSLAAMELDAAKPDLAQKLTPPQTQRTELLGSITAPRRPSAPRQSVVLALGAALGLFGGVALAFVVEAISRTGGSFAVDPGVQRE